MARFDELWHLVHGIDNTIWSFPHLTFILAYLPPPNVDWAGVTIIFVGHLLFRTAYAAVNVPYLAMSARISPDGNDRALVAGLRMLGSARRSSCWSAERIATRPTPSIARRRP